MPKNLETGWKRIGRSGDTIDGREISADDIYQAAKNYDPKFYTALIWPNHQRWFNLGKVSMLRAEKNNEGGVDLFAKLKPNDYYIQMNDAGQRLFTSMELFPNFRNTGEFYLSGLGATDNPASVATDEMVFSDSCVKEKETFVSHFTENTIHDFDDEPEQEPNWFKNFKNKYFSNNDSEADMSKKDLEKFEKQLKELTDKVNKFTTVKTPEGDDDKNTEAQNFAELSKTVAGLADKFTELETKLKDKETDDGDGAEEHYTELKNELAELTKQFKAALKENGATEAGEEAGGEDLNEYV